MYDFNSLEAVFIAHVLSLEKKGLECIVPFLNTGGVWHLLDE